MRADRHADADLARALRDRIRHHAVESDRRQDHREAGEDREQQHGELPLRERARDHVIHRARSAERDSFVDVRRRRSAAAGSRLSGLAAVVLHDEEHARPARLPERLINLRPRRRLQREMAHVANDADDLELLVVRPEILDDLADRIFAGKGDAARRLR